MFDLKIKRRRPTDLLAHDHIVVATYTLDSTYIPTYELAGKPTEYARVLPMGYVVAFDPASGKVVPHYTTYGFEAVGVNLEDVYCGDEGSAWDVVVNVLWRGDVFEDAAWDNGDFATVLAATKSALADRIKFVDENGLTRFDG